MAMSRMVGARQFDEQEVIGDDFLRAFDQYAQPFREIAAQALAQGHAWAPGSASSKRPASYAGHGLPVSSSPCRDGKCRIRQPAAEGSRRDLR
jgi:hypothetical protein